MLQIARQIGESNIGGSGIANDYYQTTEWRIFYPGHFIRRGLRGSVIEWVSHLTPLPPETLIRCLCTLAYAALTVLFTVSLFRWLWDKGRSWIPILLLSPAGLFFYQDAILSIDRFDVFFLLLTVGHLELCVRAKDERAYTIQAAALFSTLGVAAVLCHEAFLLICLPLNVVLSSWRLGRPDARLIPIYGLSLVAGGFCVFSRVSVADITVLSEQLGVPVGSFQWYNGPIALLAISATQQAAVVRSFFTLGALLPFACTALAFGTIHFAVLRRVVRVSDVLPPTKDWAHRERLWEDLFWIPFLFTLPMYVVAADYGRWFAMAVAGFTICCARLLEVSAPIKKLSPVWTAVALAIFLFLPIPLSLRFRRSSPQLLTWSGAAILGHIVQK